MLVKKYTDVNDTSPIQHVVVSFSVFRLLASYALCMSYPVPGMMYWHCIAYFLASCANVLLLLVLPRGFVAAELVSLKDDESARTLGVMDANG